MKYSTRSSDSSSAIFSEQVQQLTNFYDQWNDCERTVVFSALFKRLPYQNLKFLIHSIEHHLKQSTNVATQQLLEEAANAITFLDKLVAKYNSLTVIGHSSSIDNIHVKSEKDITGTVKTLETEIVSKYHSKIEIVQDLLVYLPLLRTNNEEAKVVYTQFIPVLAEDTIKHNLPIEMVQQMLSYLLIHPAFNCEERK
jgi:hypothetical protein